MRFYDVFLNGKNIMFCSAPDPIGAYMKACKIHKHSVLIVRDVNRNETYKVTYYPHYHSKADFLVEEI